MEAQRENGRDEGWREEWSMDGRMHCKRTGDKKNCKLQANLGESGWGVTKRLAGYMFIGLEVC